MEVRGHRKYIPLIFAENNLFRIFSFKTKIVSVSYLILILFINETSHVFAAKTIKIHLFVAMIKSVVIVLLFAAELASSRKYSVIQFQTLKESNIQYSIIFLDFFRENFLYPLLKLDSVKKKQ